MIMVNYGRIYRFFDLEKRVLLAHTLESLQNLEYSNQSVTQAACK